MESVEEVFMRLQQKQQELERMRKAIAELQGQADEEETVEEEPEVRRCRFRTILQRNCPAEAHTAACGRRGIRGKGWEGAKHGRTARLTSPASRDAGRTSRRSGSSTTPN